MCASGASNPQDAQAVKNLPLVHLQIGECIATASRIEICTVLGSCVSASFHHPKSGYSAIFHAMLPVNDAEAGSTGSCRFVDSAVALVADLYGKRGIDPRKVQVKLFGGAFSLNTDKERTRKHLDVGGRNIETARTELCRHGFRIQSENVGGSRGRKLHFHTADGTVLVRYLGSEVFQGLKDGRR